MVKLLKRLKVGRGTVSMFRWFDAPDVEAKERLRTCSLTSFRLPHYWRAWNDHRELGQ